MKYEQLIKLERRGVFFNCNDRWWLEEQDWCHVLHCSIHCHSLEETRSVIFNFTSWISIHSSMLYEYVELMFVDIHSPFVLSLRLGWMRSLLLFLEMVGFFFKSKRVFLGLWLFHVCVANSKSPSWEFYVCIHKQSCSDWSASFLHTSVEHLYFSWRGKWVKRSKLLELVERVRIKVEMVKITVEV